MTSTTYRYQLPKKAIKAACPDCGRGNTLSRYVDIRTGEALPLPYGRCDRESNCGYHLSPYHKGVSGLSYAQQQHQPPLPTDWFRLVGQQHRLGVSRCVAMQALIQGSGASIEQAEQVTTSIYERVRRVVPANHDPVLPTERSVYILPDEVFQQSQKHYEKNQFAYLLSCHFGLSVAQDLLARFQIGTSAYWPGACVFWYIDEQQRKRGGQIKLFDEHFHTATYLDSRGAKRSRTSWVHTALTRRYHDQQLALPDWLIAYNEWAERSPCLFGLPQLASVPNYQPIALVEAPKTAVLCTPYFPEFVWLAVGALSYLNEKRLAPLRDRRLVLFPDLSKEGIAFARWSRVVDQLREQGFCIQVSAYLEQRASHDQRVAGFDIGDYLLGQWPGYPPQWD